MTAIDPPISTPQEPFWGRVVSWLHDFLNHGRRSIPPQGDRLLRLQHSLLLSDAQVFTLLLAGATEFDPSLQLVCEKMSGHPYPTFGLARKFLAAPGDWSLCSATGPLRRWKLLEINQPGATRLSDAALGVDEWIIGYLAGSTDLDDRLTSYVSPMPEVDESTLSVTQVQALDKLRENYNHFARQFGKCPVVQLPGSNSSSKRLAISSLALGAGRDLYAIKAEQLPNQASELESFRRLWDRHTLLLHSILYIDAQDMLGPDNRETVLRQFAETAEGPIFIDLPGSQGLTGDRFMLADIPKPTAVEQRELWASLLKHTDDEGAANLAGQFNMELIHIRQAADTSAVTPALAIQPTNQQSTQNTPTPAQTHWESCRQRSRPKLDSLAQRIDAKALPPQLILPEVEKQTLDQIVAQVSHRSTVYDNWGFREKMNRGLGISVLFAGESGTGKTMAAEVLANKLSLDLYRIDLATVVSKYIGETEKNLRRIFDAADDGGVILFFDECDSLFSKRSSMQGNSDALDRYSNMEINYLLQRIESYSGLAILATNMKSAIDPAFMRRLRFVIDFPFPSEPQRKELWDKTLPAKRRHQDLDLECLMKAHLTGGSIQNIALGASFLAAAQNSSVVDMQMLRQAARAEFRKLGRPMNEAHFRPKHEIWRKDP